MGVPRGGADDHVAEGGFLFLQAENLLLDGVFENEFIDLHRLVLTDAVGAVGGLVHDRFVPPRVVVDDDVGAGQVEAGAAGF